MNRSLAALLLAGAVAPALAQAAPPPSVNPDAPVELRLSGAPLKESLRQLAALGGWQVVYESRFAPAVTARALRGRYSLREALTRVLSGTGFTWRLDETQRTLYVHAVPAQTEFAKIEIPLTRRSPVRNAALAADTAKKETASYARP